MTSSFDFSIEWGRITRNGKEFGDMLFVAGKALERDKDRLKQQYGTSHVVDEKEAALLLEGNPKEVIIGNGFEGVLQVLPEAKKLLESKAKLTITHSPEAIALLNEKLGKGEKVNALVHTTC